MIKEKIESALKIKDISSLVINEDFYKSNDKDSKGQKKEKKRFIYELIPNDNYGKVQKKVFSADPEIKLIEQYGITEILRNDKFPLQEKVKNFDIQYEEKITLYKELKNDNNNFNERYHKFYKDGEPVDFVPFKNKHQMEDKMKLFEKEIFAEILKAYEFKNKKIPDILKKNIFEYSPLLVSLEELKEFYKTDERLEDAELQKEIKKMLKIYNAIRTHTKIGKSLFTDYKQDDFILERMKNNDKEKKDVTKKNKEMIKYNTKIQNFIERQTEKLKEILDEKELLNRFKEIRKRSKLLFFSF